MENQNCPNNHLVKAIFVTLCCCLPLGLVGLIKATKVNTLYAAGNVAGAEDAAKSANRWCNIALFVGLPIEIIFAVIGSIAGLFQSIVG